MSIVAPTGPSKYAIRISSGTQTCFLDIQDDGFGEGEYILQLWAHNPAPIGYRPIEGPKWGITQTMANNPSAFFASALPLLNAALRSFFKPVEAPVDGPHDALGKWVLSNVKVEIGVDGIPQLKIS